LRFDCAEPFEKARPMLVVMRTWQPPSRNGWRQTWITRSRMRTASASDSMPSSISTNSSPPSRATLWRVRTVSCRRAPTSLSSASPNSWPSESLMFLKPSRSISASANGWPTPAGRVFLDPLADVGAVADAGQRIQEGTLGQLSLGLHPVRDVVAEQQQAGRAVGIAVVAHAQVDPAGPPPPATRTRSRRAWRGPARSPAASGHALAGFQRDEVEHEVRSR
jgi:hypothetical protein